MKFTNHILLALLILFFNTIHGQEKRKYNWIAPPPGVQLDMEGMDDIKGLGRVFLPAMTNPDFEPVYTVTQNDTVIKEQKMGQSVWLRPGKYTVTFGSGTLDQMMKKVIDIQVEETRIIDPDWSGLTIRIVDETREWLKEPYELFRLPEGEAYGIGHGADEHLGEKLQTWILRPGLYKIVKMGEHINTYVNFATVRLLPGELTQYTIVLDSETKNFIGAGILEFGQESRKLKNWSIFGALYGSFTLNRANDVTSKKEETSMAFVAQFDYNIKYSTRRHYFLARGIMEEGWNMQRKQTSFRSYLDNIRLKNLYVFYFHNWLGFYGRFFLETNLLRKTIFFDEPKTIFLYDENGNLEETRVNINKIVVSPNFSPLILKEGLGINLLVKKTLRTNFNVRFGMGFRQNFNHNLYVQDEEDETIFNKKPSAYLRGPEAALTFSYRIFRNVMINSELDLLVPSGSKNELVYDWENNLNFRVSKNVSIDYRLRFMQDPSIVSYVQTEQLVLLRFSYILF